MKLKFADYEAQSEKYYSEMLEKFKEQAKNHTRTQFQLNHTLFSEKFHIYS